MERAELRIAQRGLAGEQHAHGMHRRESADHADHCSQHPVRCASVAVLGVEGVTHEAPIAGLVGPVSGEIGDLSLEAADRRARQRNAQFDTGIRHQQPSREVVTPVQYHARAGENPCSVVTPETRNARQDLKAKIKAPHPFGRRFRLGLADIRWRINRLALQIADVHRVVVDQRQPSYAGCGEILKGRTADPAAATSTT